MGIPVTELQQRMSSREFSEHLAFCQIEPWGEEIEWYRFGLLASVFANCFRGKETRPFRPEDFVPQFMEKAPPGEEGQKAMYEFLKAMWAKE